MEKVLQGIKYGFWIADLAGAVGLCYSGVGIIFFLDEAYSDTAADGRSTANFYDKFWAVYYVALSFLLFLSLFDLKFMKILFGFLSRQIPRGIFICFCGTLLLYRYEPFIYEIGIYLIVVGFLHAVLGVLQWERSEGDNDPAKRYESGLTDITITPAIKSEDKKQATLDTAQKREQNGNSLNSTMNESVTNDKPKATLKSDKPLGQIWLEIN